MYTKQIDLYALLTPVSDKLSFFGRDGLLEDIRRDLMAGQSVMIFGMRKIGKTSLMLRLRQLCDWPVAMVDLQGFHHDASLTKNVWGSVLTQWREACHLRFPSLSLPRYWQYDDVANATVVNLHEATISLLNVLLAQPGSPGLLMFLDEADILAYRASYSALATAFRHLAADPQTKGRFALLSAGLQPKINRMIRISNEQNPWYSFFREVLVDPLSHEDTRAMIQSIGAQMGIDYADGALSELVFAGGGHPFLTRELCSLATRDLPYPHLVDKERVGRAIADYVADSGNYLRYLWGSGSGSEDSVEHALLEVLANQQPQLETALIVPGLPIETRIARQDAFRRLVDLGLLSRGPRGWAFTIPLYRQWIRQYVLDLDPTHVAEDH